MNHLNISQMVEQLGANDWETRNAASTALLAQGEMALSALIAGMSHSSCQVRAECAVLMDHLANARCTDALTQALNDPSPLVCRHAVHSLGCQRCKVAPLQTDIVGLLIERVKNDKSIRVRRVAVHQLGLQPYDPRAVLTLEAVLQSDTDAKLLSHAAFALNNHRQSAITA